LTDADFKAMVAGPNVTPGSVLDSVAAKVLELYPADPAVGSPYGTGDELFGLPASYKRHASLSTSIHIRSVRTRGNLSDLSIQSGRHNFRCSQEDVVSSCSEVWRQDVWVSLY
jgi:hypothetical protein